MTSLIIKLNVKLLLINTILLYGFNFNQYYGQKTKESILKGKAVSFFGGDR